MTVMTKRRNLARHMLATRRERAANAVARLICKAIGHDEERRFTGDIICYRCRTGLGRWRS